MPLRPVRINLEAIDRFSKPMNAMTARMKAFRAPIRSLQRSFRALSEESGLTRLGSVIGSVARKVAVLGAAAGALGIAGFKKFLAVGEDFVDTSAKLGIGIEALQELRFAADQSGVSAGTLDTAIVKLNKSTAEAAAGKGDAAKAYRALGIAVRDTSGKIRPATELLPAIEAGLAKIQDPAIRTRIVMALFGRGGAEMIKLLGRGVGTLRSLREEAQALGIVMSEETALAAEETGDQLSKLLGVAKGVGFLLAGALVPDVLRLTKASLAWVTANREVIRTGVLDFVNRFRDGVRETMAVLVPFLATVRSVVNALGGLKGIVTVLAVLFGAKLIFGVVQFAVALSALGLTVGGVLVALAGISLAVAAIAGLALVVVHHWEPIKAFFLGIADDVASAFERKVESIRNLFSGLLEWIRSVFSTISDLIPDFVKQGLALPFQGSIDGAALAGLGGGEQTVGGKVQIELLGNTPARVSSVESRDNTLLEIITGRAHLGG